MKQIVIKKMAVVVMAGLCLSGTLNTLAAEIAQVVVRQRWPWSRLVDIDYVLSCESAEALEINVTAYHGAEKLTLPLSSLSGDLYNVSDGTHRIVWDPMASFCANRGATSFHIELTATVPPLYMIVDLTLPADDPGQIEYVYESDLRTNVWGSWVENPVTNNGTVIQSVIWTGVMNDQVYATDKLVLRRVSAGTFGMGDSTNILATLTKDFYVGVFAVTEAQWNRVLEVSGGTTKPKVLVSYEEIRGATTSVPSIDWPTTGSEVSPSSFLGGLRAATEIAGFDLPTEAQWEYLCRAGTTTYYNDGLGTPGTTATNAQMDVLGWYAGNCNAVQSVGQKVANAWGLYDTHGNVWEWCLDWHTEPLIGGVDPTGPISGTGHSKRGGSCAYAASACRSSADRSQSVPDRQHLTIGFRLVRNLP